MEIFNHSKLELMIISCIFILGKFSILLINKQNKILNLKIVIKMQLD